MKKPTTLPHLFLFFLVFFTYSISQAQLSPAALQEKVDAMLLNTENSKGPGSAVLVVKDKKVILNKGYGLANLEHQIPISSNTVFDLASVAKQFTGYAIALLIEKGKLSKDDEIRKHLPDFPTFDQPITIGHLLHHTSGLRDWTSCLPLAGRTFDDVITFDHILDMAYKQQGLNFLPGSEYRYSNTGYNILVKIITQVTGQSFRAWTDQNIFQPLEMEHTFFLDNHNEVIPNRATGYYQGDNDQYHVVPNNLTAVGSSSLFSTTTDLARWVNHLMYPPEAFKPVVERMLETEALHNGDPNSYAYGINVGEFRGTEWISHSGSWAAFSTYLVLLPSHDLSIVVLNNQEKSAYRIARQIASYYVPETDDDPTVESSTTTVNLPSQLLNSYTGTYKLGPAWYVHITQEENQLWAQATQENKFPMTAQSDTVFLIKAYGNRTMTFYTNEVDQVTHLVYNGMICPKMQDKSTFDLKQAQDYTGDYFSAELNTWYKVQFQEDQLKLWNLHQGDIPLTPAWNDDFRGEKWYAGNIEFKRDKKNKIIGLSISQYRSKNQFFKKVDMGDLGAKN